MNPIGIFYATREGHTREIAEYVSNVLRDRGRAAETCDVGGETAANLRGYAAVILAASVHAGKHEREMIRFVKDHLIGLESLPAAFLSVSLSQAAVELPGATPEQRAAGSACVRQVLEKFYADTGWHPKYVVPVAGALLYSKYNFLVRFIMRRSARQSGGATDTSRDYVYTDWAALERKVSLLGEDFSLVAAPGLSRIQPGRDAP